MRPTLHNLQALRGIACLMVFGIHLAVWESHYGIARPLLTPFLWFGYAGVDLFFVLSGFLIAHTQAKALGNPAALPGYLFRRAWRIYPTFWVATGLAVVAFALLAALPPSPPGGAVGRWAAWLSLWPTVQPNLLVPVAWTLSYEVLFYLAFGLLLVVPRRVGPWLLFGWACLVWAAVAGGATPTTAFVRHAVSPHVWEFLAGCAVAGVVRRGQSRYGWLAVGVGVAWAAAWVPVFGTRQAPYQLGNWPLLRVVVFGPAAALVVYGLVAVERRGGWAFPGWLRRIGDASYSVYLWHTPVGAILHDWTAKWWDHRLLPHAGWLVMMTLVGVGGGVLFHRWVERPLLKLFEKRRADVTSPVVVTARVSVSPRPRTPSAEIPIGR